MELEQLQQCAFEAISNLHNYIIKKAKETHKFKKITKIGELTANLQSTLLNLVGLGVNIEGDGNNDQEF